MALIVHAFLNKTDINLCNKDGTTPLHIVCKYDRTSTVEILLSTWANISLCRKNGTSPLYLAWFIENENLVKCLLNNGANVNFHSEEVNNFFLNSVSKWIWRNSTILVHKGADKTYTKLTIVEHSALDMKKL